MFLLLLLFAFNFLKRENSEKLYIKEKSYYCGKDQVVNPNDFALMVKNLPLPEAGDVDYFHLPDQVKEILEKAQRSPNFNEKKLAENVLKAEIVAFFERKYGLMIIQQIHQVILTQNFHKRLALVKKINKLTKQKEKLVNQQSEYYHRHKKSEETEIRKHQEHIKNMKIGKKKHLFID